MLSSSPDGASFEARIRARARDFDAPALIVILRERYPERPIRFASNATLATRGTIVDAVDFAPDHILVTLNLGLGAATTPLPSYFLDLLAGAHTGPGLTGLFAIADDRLLGDRVGALSPASSARLLPERDSLTGTALALARPASPITAHWLFEAVYPELGVSVRRAPVRRGVPSDELRLGFASLGHAAFGDEAEVMVPGLLAVLSTEETATFAGIAWLEEARRRLFDRVFPAMEHTDAHLRVVLVDREAKGRLALRAPAELGFDPLEIPDEKSRPPRVTQLFEGRVPRKVAPVKPAV